MADSIWKLGIWRKSHLNERFRCSQSSVWLINSSTLLDEIESTSQALFTLCAFVFMIYPLIVLNSNSWRTKGRFFLSLVFLHSWLLLVDTSQASSTLVKVTWCELTGGQLFLHLKPIFTSQIVSFLTLWLYAASAELMIAIWLQLTHFRD